MHPTLLRQSIYSKADGYLNRPQQEQSLYRTVPRYVAENGYPQPHKRIVIFAAPSARNDVHHAITQSTHPMYTINLHITLYLPIKDLTLATLYFTI